MDSSVIVNHVPSEIADTMDVNGGQSPNALSPGINGAGIAADGGSGCCLFASDESDDSFSDSINVSNLKRKYGSESGNCSSSEEDGSVSIVKSRKLNIPLFVEPIRSVKASEFETPVSPASVKVENLTAPKAPPLSLFPMENLEDDSKDNNPPIKSCRQFWKAGDYEGNCNRDAFSSSGIRTSNCFSVFQCFVC